MSNEPKRFRERLMGSQEITPALRAAYDKEIDNLLHEPVSRKNRILATILLLIMLAIVVLEIRALIIAKGSWSLYVGAATMILGCGTGSIWLARDLCKTKVLKKSAHQLSELVFGMGSLITVVALLKGVGAASDPASTFNALFVFVCLFVFAVWALGNRIAAAEMASKEQMLRLECRLAEIAERLKA